MWACPTTLLPPPPPRPLDAIITCTQPNRIFFVSAKYQPRRENTNFNYNLDDDEVAPETEDSVEDTYFTSQDSGEQQQVPSGCDILRALRRASVRKHTNKKKKKQQQVRPGPDSKEKQDVISNAPLRIRSDWTSRLDDLELRLRDLLHV